MPVLTRKSGFNDKRTGNKGKDRGTGKGSRGSEDKRKKLKKEKERERARREGEGGRGGVEPGEGSYGTPEDHSLVKVTTK